MCVEGSSTEDPVRAEHSCYNKQEREREDFLVWRIYSCCVFWKSTSPRRLLQLQLTSPPKKHHMKVMLLMWNIFIMGHRAAAAAARITAE